MELLSSYLQILRNPAVPSHRVVRKTAGLCLLAVCALVYYRHFNLGFSTGEAVLVTVVLALLLFGVVGIFGGLLTGSFYESFLRDVGARRTGASVYVFFAEWLFALASPLIGMLAFGLIAGHMQ